jgi:FixJ family two-component response regulator
MNVRDPTALGRPEIVVVDDDEALLSALELRLGLEGFPVAAFTSGEAALAASPEAACFVLDLRLPGMTGLEYLAKVRGRGETAPAILITSRPTPATIAQAAAAGVSIVEKPLLNDSLAEAVRKVLAPV